MKQEDIEAIGEYVKNHIPQWLKEADIIPKDYSTNTFLVERVVRVEEMRHDMVARFEQADRKFEMLLQQMDKRFEQVDKRFEDLRYDMNSRFEQVDKRFEDLRNDMNSRFEQVDKRFEEMRHDMNSRFEELRNDMNKKFSMMFFYLTTIFAVVGTLVTVFGLIS